MNKNDLRRKITTIDPNSKIAVDQKSTIPQLERELMRVQRVAVSGRASDEITATVKFRHEESGGFSWHIESSDFYSEVQHGRELPLIGTTSTDDEGNTLRITEQTECGTIRACDMCNREIFDPRRIYRVKTTGVEVVFKRVDQAAGKPVVWSFGTGMEIMIGVGMEMIRTDRTAKPIARCGGMMTQKNLAAFLIGQDSSITAAELTEALREAFPSSNVGDRHGPHYLSLSRNGRLPEAPATDPRTWSKQ